MKKQRQGPGLTSAYGKFKLGHLCGEMGETFKKLLNWKNLPEKNKLIKDVCFLTKISRGCLSLPCLHACV